MRYFFHIGYNGANYSGWQKHSGVLTVQQCIENAFMKVLKVTIPVIGCGRTDAMVHASQFFFHADINIIWDFDLLFRLNKALPSDIAVFDIIKMDGLPHARFDAIQRRYSYFIHTYKDPFLKDFSSLYLNKELNLDAMKQAAALLSNYDDYGAFCKSPDKNTHTICRVSFADIHANAAGDRLYFQISSNRFLGRMIRILMGKILKVGEGKLSVDEFESYLAGDKIPLTLQPAYPQGLYLSKVTYPYLDLPARQDFSMNLFNV